MNKIEITILDRPTAADKKTAVFPSRRRRKLGRRRLRGGIRFYDLGYYYTGSSWANLPFVDPNIADPILFSGASTPPYTARSVTSAYYNDLNTLIFSNSLSTWKGVFRKINDDYIDSVGSTPGDFFFTHRGVSYNIHDDAVFTNGVFTPDQTPVDNTFSIIAGGNLYNSIGNDSDYKWTDTYSYAASPVSFIPTDDMDIFLLPKLVRMYAHYRLSGGTPSDIREILGWYYVIWPRETQIDSMNEHFAFNRDGATIYSNPTWTEVGGSGAGNVLQYQLAYQGIQMMKDLFDDYAETFNGPATWTRASLTAADFLPSAYFPTPPTTPPGPEPDFLEWGGSVAIPPNGTLLGVVKNGSTYYYCWADA